jgi:PAS domain S-box-containing protein
MLPNMPAGLLGLVLLMVLACQPSVAVHAQIVPQGLSHAASKCVLVLYTYGDGLPAYQKATPAFLSVMTAAGVNVNDLFFEYLDLQRRKDAEHRRKLADLFRHKYAGQKIDMIVTFHIRALEFLLNEGKEIFPEAPVLSILVAPDAFPKIETGHRFVHVPIDMDFRGTLELALKIFAKTQRVVFVSGYNEGDLKYERDAKKSFDPWRDKISFEYLSNRSVEEMLQRVSTLPPLSIVIYANVFTDKTGRNFIPREVGGRIAQAANAPVFGLFDTLLGTGIIGGSMLSFEAEGTRAGKLAIDILNESLPLTEPVTTITASRTAIFDSQQLKRWGARESRLPSGTIFVNHHPTLWERYKGYVGSAIFILFVQSLLIITLLVQRRRKKTAEEKYRNIFEGSLEGIFETSLQGQVLTANPAMARILGYDSPDDLTSTIRDAANQIWVNPEARADYVRLIEKQNAVFRHECQFWRKDRTKIWVSLSARRVSVPDGKTFCYSGFIEDITERKRAEDEIAGARAELLRVERSMRLNEMTASLAHELNQPLAAILNNAQAALNFLKADKPDLNEFREILQDIISDDQRAGNVIRSLRSMMKREVGEKKPIILNDIVNDVIQIFRSEAIFRNVRMEAELDGSSLLVMGDKTQLQQVILNMVMNAAEAMSQSQPEHRKLIMRTERKGQSIWMTLRDFGPGIDRENLERVFQPFFTTKGTGLGMGLAVCSSIIKDHRGRIWAENNPDGGATFFIELPICESGK